MHSSPQTRRLALLPRCFTLPLRGGEASDSNGIQPVPKIDEPPVWAKEKRALLLMDVFSEYHGYYLAHRARELYGVATIFVFSDYMRGFFEQSRPEDLDEMLGMCMPDSNEAKEWCRHLNGIELTAISCESDSGLADAERLGVILGLTYHDGFNEARRNKYLMNEAAGDAGLSIVKQRLCKNVAEAIAFATELGIESQASSNQPMVVVKPVRGVASDDVFLCTNLRSVESAFRKIHGSTIFGSPHDTYNEVLLQEFASGQEYAVDIVSKNGQHKIAAIWKYDKRPANGAPFVYYATKICDESDAKLVFNYLSRCLDALGIRWGLSHNEVIITADGPRLVEVNCRQHNMDFCPITMACIGYNALDMLLSAYFGGKDPDFYPAEAEGERLDWDLIPTIPAKRMHGAMIHLVNYQQGKLAEVNEIALREIHEMESVLDMQVYGAFLEIGAEISPTRDIRSDAGWVQLINEDQEQFQKDFERIVELMPSLFIVES